MLRPAADVADSACVTVLPAVIDITLLAAGVAQETTSGMAWKVTAILLDLLVVAAVAVKVDEVLPTAPKLPAIVDPVTETLAGKPVPE